jgi:general secretion pathway protein G
MVKRRRPPRLANAYTLTEMLVVLVIIGLLAAIVGPRLFNRLDEAKRRTAELQMKSLQSSIDLFRIDVGRIPTAQEGLDVLVHAPADAAENWLGPYIAHDTIPVDPWGHGYAYAPAATGSRYQISSFAADGRPGGSGAGADLVVVSGDQDAPAAPQSAAAPAADGGALR